MTREPDFRSLVGNDLPEDEESRLRRAHDLLVAAGPPAELPPALATAPAEPAPTAGERVPGLPAPRRGRVLALALSFAAVTLVVGFLFGARNNDFDTQFSVQMNATAAAPGASGVIDVADRDESGNWPLRMKVRGLRDLPAGAYYELLLTRPGRPNATCGTFRIHAGTTEVRLNAPYDFGNRYGWIVNEHRPGQAPSKPLLQARIVRT